MLFDLELPMELKKVAISKKPSLLEMTDKSVELLRIAFSVGYWSDDIKTNLTEMTEEDICGFISKTSETYLEKFLEICGELSESESVALVGRDGSYYNLPIMKKSDELDWSIIRGLEHMDADTPNPLTYAFQLTTEKVDFLYQKFGKFALMGIPTEFQTIEMKKEIIEKNSYDYSFILFDKEIAELYVEKYFATIPYLMKQNKYDPYYNVRVLMILSIYGAALKFLEFQTEEMQIISIKNNPLALEYAVNPSETVCMLALQMDKDTAKFIKNKTKAICKFLGIQYVKPSKYDSNIKYLVAMSQDEMSCFRVVEGKDIDSYLDMECDTGEKVKKISKVKEISDDEIKTLKKFGIFKTVNPFFEEEED